MIKKNSEPAKSGAAGKAATNGNQGFRQLFIDSLKDIYWAEQALLKALPKMFDQATDVKLKTAIKEHLDQTHGHVARLEEVFSLLRMKAEGKKCEAMDGLIKEGESVMKETEPGAVRDAGIISAAQKVEHYEIAAYGTMAAFAKVLNERDILNLLLKTLGEEKKSDCLLSTIADTNLNAQALSTTFKPQKAKAV
ncbi:MAG: ferritin-like domain-containing protein [Chitinophagaceae bacterium]|nr:MAG: ferritin-like domain-containing protein [Chitinophagaceae bacterium]